MQVIRSAKLRRENDHRMISGAFFRLKLCTFCHLYCRPRIFIFTVPFGHVKRQLAPDAEMWKNQAFK